MKCVLPLQIAEGDGETAVQLEFLVETGCTRTVMSLQLARYYELPTSGLGPQRRINWNTPAGWTSPAEKPQIPVQDGRLRVWWNADRKGEPFDWPVLFLVEAHRDIQPVLGLGRVIRDCQWVFNGRPEDEAEFGTATFHDIRT